MQNLFAVMTSKTSLPAESSSQGETISLVPLSDREVQVDVPELHNPNQTQEEFWSSNQLQDHQSTESTQETQIIELTQEENQPTESTQGGGSGYHILGRDGKVL